MSTLQLMHVEFLPSDLEEGILYVSKKYAVAGHLCPCGCRSKIITPLGRNEWRYSEKKALPTLYPSIGNWQLPCRSHYWITNGAVEWSYNWNQEKIDAGAKLEEKKRKDYYEHLEQKQKNISFLSSLRKWFKGE
jgi:hypothetical protein